MLALLFIYMVGRRYYELAFRFKKNQWAYAILGVVSYYGGTILGGIAVVIIASLLFDTDMTTYPDMALNVISIPFGILACWGLYKILERNWEKRVEIPETEEVLDGNLRSD